MGSIQIFSITRTFISVQSLSRVWLFLTPWTAAPQVSLSITNSTWACSNSRPSSWWCVQPSHPLWVPSPPAFNLCEHPGFFQWVYSSHEVGKVLEFQLQHSPSSEYSGLISLRMDWLDLLAVQGTLKSLLQHHSPTLTSILDYWKNHILD